MIKKEKGFTLVELLIVVVIVGLLAAIIIPKFLGQPERGVVSEAVTMLSAIRQAEASYYLAQSTPAYTSNLTDLDLDTTTSTQFTYTIVGGSTFTATATRVDDPNSTQDCPTKTITLTDAGVWGGTHPYGPKPNPGAVCTP